MYQTIAFSFYVCDVSRYHSYLNSAARIISQYKGDEPLSTYLKKYFAAEKKYGSKDRKEISQLCYCFYRTGNLLSGMPVEQRIIASLFLCSSAPGELLKNLQETWNEKTGLPAQEKISVIGANLSVENIFPLHEELSEGVEQKTFILSHLQQPDLFLRIRPGHEHRVIKELNDHDLPFSMINSNCIALPNSTKIDQVLDLNKEVVVQDLNSQRITEFLNNDKLKLNNNQLTLWDCCAASGGKSILANDVLGDVDITVSDIRESILINLKKRFKEAGISRYHSFVCDLSKERSKNQNASYQLIIADVPCSGSGTWARTPEQLSFFREEEIDRYSSLQKKIISNIIPSMEKNGHLLYITCSVFRKENEENVQFIKKQFHLELVKMELLKGYDQKADSMFAALLKKSS